MSDFEDQKFFKVEGINYREMPKKMGVQDDQGFDVGEGVKWGEILQIELFHSRRMRERKREWKSEKERIRVGYSTWNPLASFCYEGDAERGILGSNV